MATYAIGDIQGCYAALQHLLQKLDFDAARDRLWFTGDLVNRGPESAAVVRFVMGLGESAIVVLGNHDLHLLAVAHQHGRLHPRDTLTDILTTADRGQLVDWLQRRPLLHHDAGLGYTLVHAGLAPQWDLATAMNCANEVETTLREGDVDALFAHMYGNEPALWSDGLTGWERQRFIINAFTRLRYCDTTGHLHLRHKGAPGTQPQGLIPWFDAAARASAGARILFGHWSTLGRVARPDIFALDTGCIWGGELTALRLEDGQVFAVKCPMAQRPGAV